MAYFSSLSSSKPRNLSPFRFRKPSSQEKIPSFTSSRATSCRSLTPRSNSPGLRFSSASSADSSSPVLDFMDSPTDKENVSVTVRLRPLSQREIYKGDQAAWYADGDTLVRSEYNPSTAYAYDRVFGPATTTRGVYDVAARHVVRGAMEGVNGTVFAYGVTSSGKTHTMHGDQKSPGIIPLAIKDVFNIIQDTVGRDFLLRVSYLEIYNEVINDLLDPIGQNLRVREDAQGTYVEGIKEEVVLSPAHALSLIAAGEEHRHVGSNNINLQSSRSHTIFNLTIESSAHGDSFDEVTLSQLNLIDLAGSESSKSETTGLRRKEGTYINKSLLTLGTVISKLSDGKSSHIPYRDSKLTRLLQSSLSGHGRVSLICTITPASSNMEETHNTLKFAHRAKRVELHTAPNRIIDDKSLIKKYQKQICSLKQELEQVKRGTLVASSQEDIVSLKEKLEAGQVRLQSRLEEEEQAKAALMGRIQRLTKLILVSTKNTIPVNFPERPAHRRRHSFGEDELAYLPSKKHDLICENDDDPELTGKDADFSANAKGVRNSADDILKDEKKNKKRGMLSWFKMRKQDALIGSPVVCPENENFPNGSPPASAGSSTHSDLVNEFKSVYQKSSKKRMDELAPVIDSFPGPTQAGELFSVTSCGWKPPPTGTTITDQMDLLKEQVKMLAGEVAFCTSSLKRLSEQVSNNPDDTQSKIQMLKMEDEIEEKKEQMRILKQRMIGIGEASADGASRSDLQQVITNLMSQLDEKTFDLEIMSADNRILQEQFQAKSEENDESQETIRVLRQQLASALGNHSYQSKIAENFTVGGAEGEMYANVGTRTELVAEEDNRGSCEELRGQMLLQAAEIEKLKQDKVQLIEEKGGLQIQGQKLAEEATYAKELASAAAVELKNLAEEVSRLAFQNTKLAKELEAAQDMAFSRTNKLAMANGLCKYPENKMDQMQILKNMRISGDTDFENDIIDDIDSWNLDSEDIKRELRARKEREAALEAILVGKEQTEAELQKKIDEYRKREADLENDLAGMWVLVANLRKQSGVTTDVAVDNDVKQDIPIINNDGPLKIQDDENNKKECEKDKKTIEELITCLENEKRQGTELDRLIAQLKSEDLEGLDLPALEDLQSLHFEALTKLSQVKAQMQENFKENESDSLGAIYEEQNNAHICRVCFQTPTAAILLPCLHFCSCKPCAAACTECPLCRTKVADRISVVTS